MKSLRVLIIESSPDATAAVLLELGRAYAVSHARVDSAAALRARVGRSYGEVPKIRANEGRLGQVFLNLVVNAAQAIPEGNPEQHEIALSTGLLPDGRVRVEVRDSGVGMAPDVLERLFTPFFTTKPVGVGTGLGLSICHRIVSALGGEISVDSRPGRGSVFCVILPAAPASVASATPPPSAAPAAAARRGKVLAIDDEPMMVKVIQRMLSIDHEVSGSIGAQDAMAWIAAGQRFDVILCDLMMPGMSGMDFFSELTRIAPEQAKRVIFLTGGAFTPRTREFLDGVENVRIEKPFEPASLRAIVSAKVGAT